MHKANMACILCCFLVLCWLCAGKSTRLCCLCIIQTLVHFVFHISAWTWAWCSDIPLLDGWFQCAIALCIDSSPIDPLPSLLLLGVPDTLHALHEPSSIAFAASHGFQRYCCSCSVDDGCMRVCSCCVICLYYCVCSCMAWLLRMELPYCCRTMPSMVFGSLLVRVRVTLA